MNSNIQIQSNLMIDEGYSQEKYKYLPGDFIALVHPGKVDKRVMHKDLTPRQISEFNKYNPCSYCHKLICKCLPNRI